MDWSQPTSWTAPLTLSGFLLALLAGLAHFSAHSSRRGWPPPQHALLAGRTSHPAVRPAHLLAYRATVLALTASLLLHSSLAAGPSCLRFFTVWNFIALVACFALGTALSCAHVCAPAHCAHAPSAAHALAAAAHHLLLEIELPMSAMIAAVVWLVLYPYDQDNHLTLLEYTNLTSLSMHGLNVCVLLLEFALDALDVRPEHVGLFTAWGMLYALFNGTQALWTHDTVYFFMDLTRLKTPLVALALACLMWCLFGGACLLSRLKWEACRRAPPGLEAALLPAEPAEILQLSRQLWGEGVAEASGR
ncbi:hypothetical protein AB1Y20_001824 [Prymnesium parvum]|uniref:Uncharacterized protein n=1 Tax=Prymnesium parvum TaxID=97485 RepID=A0AB34KCF9_PRYPA